MVFAVCDHLAKHEFRHVINTEDFDSFVTEILGSCFELNKERKGFVMGFHEE